MRPSFRAYDRELSESAVKELIRNTNLVGPGVEKALLMEAEGHTHKQIGEALGVHASSVTRALAKFRDTRKLARFRLHASADQLATHAISASQAAAAKGDGSIALELLDRIDVAVAKRREGQGGAQVMVVVGQANPTALPDFSGVAQLPPVRPQDALEATTVDIPTSS